MTEYAVSAMVEKMELAEDQQDSNPLAATAKGTAHDVVPLTSMPPLGAAGKNKKSNFRGAPSATFSIPVSWYNLHYRAGKKRILSGLTGTALPSRCLAILGASGAGKTTFLNALCDQLAYGGRLKLRGRRQLGDVEFQRHYRKALGFVNQDDVVSALTTPEDSMWFSLRTRRGTTRAETHARVEEMLEILRLVDCRSTQVGVPGLVAGLSGGERKRCNIGIELICDPKVLLLDEPTSGLDSVTAAKIVRLLKQLSRSGRTIIYTVHQPTAEVLLYFDDLMLLTTGQCAFHGTMAASIEYFESIGFKCPDQFTPTDYYMLLLQDTVTSKVLVKRWKKFLKNGPRSVHTVAVSLAAHASESRTATFLNSYIKSFGSSFFVQFYELTGRTMIENSRNFLYLLAWSTQAIFFAIIVGLIFINIRDDMGGVQDRQGLLFMVVMNRAMGCAFITLHGFNKMRPIYVRETQSGSYTPFVYLISWYVANLPLRQLFVFSECLILYFMAHLYVGAEAFFYYYLVCAVLSEVTVAFGYSITTVFQSLVVSSAVTPMLLMAPTLTGGLFSGLDRIRPAWYFVEKPSFIRHAYILLMRNEFQHLHHIQCDNYKLGDLYCFAQVHTGDDVLRDMSFTTDPQSTIPIMWFSLVALFFIFYLISFYALIVAARKKM